MLGFSTSETANLYLLLDNTDNALRANIIKATTPAEVQDLVEKEMGYSHPESLRAAVLTQFLGQVDWVELYNHFHLN